MKLHKFLFIVMFVSLSNTKAKALVFRVRSFRPVVPVAYPSLAMRIIPIKRCFKNNILTKCLTSSPDVHTYSFTRHISNSAKSNSKIDLVGKLDQGHGRDQEYENSKTSQNKNILPIKKINLKLDQPILRSLMKYLPKFMPVETKYEVEETETVKIEKSKATENSIESNNTAVNLESEKIKAMENLTEKLEAMENSNDLAIATENVSINTDIVVNTAEKIETMESPSDTTETEENSIWRTIFPTKRNATFVEQKYFPKCLISALDQFDRRLYLTNFAKFSALTPASKGDSGMSFAQSGLFLEMALMAISTEVDLDTKNEINQNFALNISDADKIKLIKYVISSLPNSSEELKFRWSSRLVLRSGLQLSQQFISGAAEALRLKIDHFEDSQRPQKMAQVLNRMIEEDSDGAIRDTFEEEDLTENEQAVLITTLYFRASWRTAPTLLNGTWLFRDSGNAPLKTIRMIRVNDIMKYVDLPEWDAEAIEIPYLTEGLSLLLLVPRGYSLKGLVEHVETANLTSVTERMQNIRIAASLPLYTLRMTLLLPNKLQAMGVSRVVNASGTEGGSLRISQAVQRIMFWAEAGRNAYKDDGIEWDETPEMKIVIDRPYMFCVRWQNLNLMVGNFVL